MTFKHKLARRLAISRSALLASAVALFGCAAGERSLTDPTSIDSATYANRPVASVTVSPSSASGTVGQTAQFTATVLDAHGNVLTDRTVTWSTSNSAVVTVSGTGFATAVGSGSVQIIATSGGKQGTASVTVAASQVTAPERVSDLTVASVTDTSATLSFTEVSDGAGLPASYEVRYAADSISWGSATTVARGTCATPVMGTAIGAKRTCTVLGLLPSTAYGFQLVAFRGTLNVDAVFGALSNTAGATSAAPGVVAVASVAVDPASASGTVGQTGQFTAILKDANGNVLTGRVVTWTSSNTAIVTVDAGGIATAVGAGSATITATSEGKSGTSQVTVTGGSAQPVASVSVSPATASIAVGGTQQFAATLRDANGNTLTGRTVAWSSSNPVVAAVSGSGLATALLAGTATITATSEGQSGSASLTVTLLPPPPSGGWPNEPAGLTTITDQPWDALTTLGWNIVYNANGYVTIGADLLAPQSAPSVLQYMYPAGFAGGSAPATEYIGLPSAKRIYMGMWWKASNPWQGHSSGVNKIQFLFPGSGGDIYMAMYGPPGGPYELSVLPQFPNLPSSWYRPNVANVPVTLGQWHRIEWLIDYSASSSNGGMQWWLDGQLIGSYTNVQFPSAGMIEYHLSPTWGGMGDTKSQTDYYWFDQVRISGN